jgi:hypothetical protein
MRIKVLILCVVVCSFLLLGCLSVDNDEPTTIESAPSGTARFSKESIQKFGCPQPEKIPIWIEIPECKK